jgi:hypothetical protein
MRLIKLSKSLLFVFLMSVSLIVAAMPEIFDDDGHSIGRDAVYPDKHADLSPFTGIGLDGKKALLRLRSGVLAEFIQLQQRAQADGVQLSVSSAYRSIASQRQIRKRYPSLAEAPGHSEHHLGTTVDFTKVKDDSPAFLWLLRHGFEAGWVPAYYYRHQPKFPPEPWHWRYVGVPAAQAFYDYWRDAINADLQRLAPLPSKPFGQVIVRTRCAECLQLRRAPSLDSESLARLPRASKLPLLARAGEWYQVAFNGQIGYVHHRYVEEKK